MSIGCDERTRAPQISIHSTHKGKSIRTMGRTRMTAAAKRLTIYSLTDPRALFTYHSTAGFFSLAQQHNSVSWRAAGAAAGAASASDAPPMRVCVHARTPICRRTGADESRRRPLTSQSQPLVDLVGARWLSETAPPLSCGGGGARRGAAVRCSAASRHQRRRSSGRRSGAASLTRICSRRGRCDPASESHWRRESLLDRGGPTAHIDQRTPRRLPTSMLSCYLGNLNISLARSILVTVVLSFLGWHIIKKRQ